MTPIVDCHTHTLFSDGEPTFEENVRAAAAAGCRVLVSTDHLTLPAVMDPGEECQVSERDLAAYRAAWEEARDLAASIAPDLELVFGFECDWYEGCEENVERWSAGAVVRLGSTHWIGDPTAPGFGSGWIDDYDNEHVWDELGANGVWRSYVDAWCRACESPLAFDSMAHPDLPRRFVNEGRAPTIDLQPLWDQMAECAAACGRRVEINTAGIRKGTGSFYPEIGLLKTFRRAGVHITVGSDAHRACDICFGIRDAYAYAASAGYASIEVPHADGSWETLSIN